MEFEIRGEKYVIKPYLCSPSNKFPFYINITNVCNAKCDFCCNANNKSCGEQILIILKKHWMLLVIMCLELQLVVENL